MSGQVHARLGLADQAVYRIRLRGVLGEAWHDRVGGMQVFSYRPDGEGGTEITMLVGMIADQAALAGVLNLIYTLGLPLLDVTCLGQALELPAPQSWADESSN